MEPEMIPTIKLEINGMKAAIVSALGLVGSDLGQYIESEVDKAINSFDWQGEVERVSHEAIRECIAAFFKDGQGRRVVREAIIGSLSEYLPEKDPQ